MKYLKRWENKIQKPRTTLKANKAQIYAYFIKIRPYHACAGFEDFGRTVKPVSMLFTPELFSLVVIAIIFRCF